MKLPRGSWCLVGLLLPGALAQADVLRMRNGESYTGTVMRVVKDVVTIKTAAGELSLPRRDIVRLDVPETDEYKAGIAALKARDFNTALTNLRPVVQRLGGLPLFWVANAASRLGDAHVGAKDFPAALRAYEEFKQLYPDVPLAQNLDVKLARIRCAQKDWAKALDLAGPMVTNLLKKDFLTPAEEGFLAEALVSVGDAQAETGKKDEALESYLKVVALFDLDADLAAEAQFKAAGLFGEKKNWKRAKDSYTDVVARAPNSAWATEAKQRLAAITQAHPE
jgi:TolA-binding protein